MTPARVKHYQSLGWQFRIEPYVDYHKGTDEVFHYAKSPRMRGAALICCPYRKGPYDNTRSDLPWEDMTERELLKWEADKRGHQAVFSDESYDMRSQLAEQIRKAVLKDPDAKEVTITVKLA